MGYVTVSVAHPESVESFIGEQLRKWLHYRETCQQLPPNMNRGLKDVQLTYIWQAAARIVFVTGVPSIVSCISRQGCVPMLHN